ncbi:MAG: hypothetical protein ABMB14_30820, partial [Myxococcota bacterium]
GRTGDPNAIPTLAMSAGFGLVRPDGANDLSAQLGLDVPVGGSFSIGAGLRYRRASGDVRYGAPASPRAAVDLTLGGEWCGRGRWSPLLELAIGASDRWYPVSATEVRRRVTPIGELDLGTAVRLSPRLQLRSVGLLQLDGRMGETVQVSRNQAGTPAAPTPAPVATPAAAVEADRPWRLGAGVVLVWRFPAAGDGRTGGASSRSE